MSFEVSRGALHLDGRVIDLPFPAAEGFSAGDGFVVRLEVPAGERCNRNVLFFDQAGVQVWQIQESPHGTDGDKPYMRIWEPEGGTLAASNWNGVDYNVDLASGEISVRSFNR